MTGNPWVAAPQGLLMVGAVIVYTAARLFRARNSALATLTTLTFALALGALIPVLRLAGTGQLPTWGYTGRNQAFLRADAGAVIVAAIALALGMLAAMYSGHYLERDTRQETFYPLLLLLVVGVIGVVLAADLFNLYMFCEVMSAAAYVLVAFRRSLKASIEAGFKYLVMGSVGTVTMLLGLSFVYRESGSLALSYAAGIPGPWMRAGIGCLLVGLAIKSALVPLHTWLPDAHSRAPSSISAMLSGIVVQSTFYALLKVCLVLGVPAPELGTLLIWLSFLGMTVGNALALVQTQTKRLLAYSTIAQMGYMILTIGIGLRNSQLAAIQAGFFLLLAHAAMKGLAFLGNGVYYLYCHADTLDELPSAATRLPTAALPFAITLAGLAGVPPLAGFASKWLIATDILRAGDTLGYLGLALFLLNSLLALGYYLPLIGRLLGWGVSDSRHPRPETSPLSVSPWMLVPLLTLVIVVVGMGVYPQPWLHWAMTAGEYLMQIGR